MHQKYGIVLKPMGSEDGGGWVATVPDLPGCMGDGETQEEALRDVESAIEAWIQHAKDLGREIPKPKGLEDYSGKFTLRLPKMLHQELEQRSKQDNVSLNQTAVYLLAYALGKTDQGKVKN
ncbi:type II toxin-antitoxin system HicB family antitoxin [Alicyclobacillus fodiniaquatilis]|uniref:Type II toxin-antitoxin system HicB family antitoxin n=1 Tax=Alicyclobacillus fodiniaquatilis TaxID=1661150 RepID=A0ABW4JBU9_9BACL